MILGKNYKIQIKKRVDAQREILKQAIPHLVFVWWPVDIETGQKAWLQHVWRVKYNFETINPQSSYFIDLEAALVFSEKANYSSVYAIYILKQLK